MLVNWSSITPSNSDIGNDSAKLPSLVLLTYA